MTIAKPDVTDAHLRLLVEQAEDRLERNNASRHMADLAGRVEVDAVDMPKPAAQNRHLMSVDANIGEAFRALLVAICHAVLRLVGQRHPG